MGEIFEVLEKVYGWYWVEICIIFGVYCDEVGKVFNIVVVIELVEKFVEVDGCWFRILIVKMG